MSPRSSSSGSVSPDGPGRRLAAVVLSPRWLLALLAAIAFAAACIPLGLWQWTRTQDIVESERSALLAPVDVREVTRPGEEVSGGDVGRSVLATGEYEQDGQVLITERSVDGEPGVWVWTPLRLADGSAVGVLRGWLPDADAPGVDAPEGEVSIRGTLNPDEAFYADAPVVDGRALSVDSRRLGPSGTRGGFVMLEEQQPATAPAPVLVPQSDLEMDLAFPIRNFLYSFQWWIFGAFALVAWGVLAWREARDRAIDATAPAPAPAGTVTPHE